MAAVYAIKENELSFRVLDGEAVIISSTTGYYYSLNRSGTSLWTVLADGGRDAESLAAVLAEHYDRDAAGVGADVRNVLAVLVAEGLVAQQAEGATAASHAALTDDQPYEAPQLVKFDRLQRLMVCGE